MPKTRNNSHGRKATQLATAAATVLPVQPPADLSPVMAKRFAEIAAFLEKGAGRLPADADLIGAYCRQVQDARHLRAAADQALETGDQKTWARLISQARAAESGAGRLAGMLRIRPSDRGVKAAREAKGQGAAESAQDGWEGLL